MSKESKLKKVKLAFLLEISYMLSIVHRKIYAPILINRIRTKDKISVVFIVQEIGVWKTEELYLEMLNNTRFEPRIIIPRCIEVKDGEKAVEKYCVDKGYEFDILDDTEYVSDKCHADIIFYQKPYLICYPRKCRIYYNLNSLFCYVYYTFHTFDDKWPYKPRLFFWCWQHYFENTEAVEYAKKYMKNKCNNGVVTGVPMSDIFMKPIDEYKNPWRFKDSRKKIIYAPHHSGILKNDTLNYSTFLEYGEFMLEMAAKYSDMIVIAFKPHPSLKAKLQKVWGVDKTERYYKKWNEIDNGQLEMGDYVNLFMHSDALIHDCSSFTIEYHYTHKPVMFLEKDQNHSSNLLPYVKKAYDLHYKAHSAEDIEHFIKDIISGNDSLALQRKNYFKQYLMPPKGNSACKNIIDSILGVQI